MIFRIQDIAKLAAVPHSLIRDVLKLVAQEHMGDAVHGLIEDSQASIVDAECLIVLIEHVRRSYIALFNMTDNEIATATGYSKSRLLRLRKGEVQRRPLKGGGDYVYTAKARLQEGTDWIMRNGAVLYRPESITKLTKGSL